MTMRIYQYDGTETRPITTKSADNRSNILGQADKYTANPRRNHRLKKVLALIGGLAAAGLIITFIIERSAG
jgi:hypothetical protein